MLFPLILELALVVVTALGGFKLLHLESRGMAVTGGIAGCVLSFFNFFCLPFAVWALAVASRRDVRDAFGKGHLLHATESPLRQRHGAAWPVAAAITAAVLLLLAIPVGVILLPVIARHLSPEASRVSSYEGKRAFAVQQKLLREVVNHLEAAKYRWDQLTVAIHYFVNPDIAACTIEGLRKRGNAAPNNGSATQRSDALAGELDIRHTGRGLWTVRGSGDLSNVTFIVDTSAEMGTQKRLVTLLPKPFQYAEPEEPDPATSLVRDVTTSRPAARSQFPKAAHIGQHNYSVTIYHDDVDLHYALLYKGEFNSSTRDSHNTRSKAWTDDGSLKLRSGRTFGYLRESPDADRLRINGWDYDLRQGRVLVLNDDGTVAQSALFPTLAVARDPEQLARLINAAPRFGPVREVTLTEFNNRDGQEALDLDTGKVWKQPKDMDEWSDAGLTEWVTQNGIDLFVDHGPGGRWGLLTTLPTELRLGRVPNDKWQVISEADLRHTLTNSLLPLEVVERGSLKIVMLPKEAQPPPTLAFQTSTGGLGLLQVTGFTENPLGLKIRYKLVQKSGKVVRLEDLSEAERARAVALFNDIEDFGHEFEAAFATKSLPAAETGTRRLLNLLSNFNAVVKGTGYEFSAGIFEDIGKVQQALKEGDWDKVQQAARHNDAYAREFKRIGARMVELAREQQAGCATAVFGPVVERVIAGKGDANKRFIDLDKGRLFAAAEFFGPKAEPSPEETQKWLSETGIDAVADTRSLYGGLVGFNLVASPVPNEEWDRMPPSRVGYYFAMSAPGTPVTMTGKGGLPATFAVRTREGAQGLLQIVGINTNDPPEVRIRYRLVQAGGAEKGSRGG